MIALTTETELKRRKHSPSKDVLKCVPVGRQICATIFSSRWYKKGIKATL